MCNWENTTLSHFITTRGEIYKQHLLPIDCHTGVVRRELARRVTRANFSLATSETGPALPPTKKHSSPSPGIILLVRDPRDAAAAYTRHKSMVERFKGNTAALRAESVKHVAALSAWRAGWLALAGNLGPEAIMVVTTSELISNLSHVVTNVAHIWDLTVSKASLDHVQLARERFTGVSTLNLKKTGL